MLNMRIIMKAMNTEWEFVCEAKRTGDMIAAGIEKLEDEFGEGVLVTITAQATNDAIDI